jgi:hypothetical protein
MVWKDNSFEVKLLRVEVSLANGVPVNNFENVEFLGW